MKVIWYTVGKQNVSTENVTKTMNTCKHYLLASVFDTTLTVFKKINIFSRGKHLAFFLWEAIFMRVMLNNVV